VIAQLEKPDGTAYRVTQVWNCWAEPYTGRLFMCSPEGEWGSCCIDHQSERWRSTKLSFDERENRVLLTLWSVGAVAS
jgi:hypothetical protein